MKDDEVVDAELSPDSFSVEAGFALRNSEDPRYQAAVRYKTHFGHVIHKAAIALRGGSGAGEDHIDAVISIIKVCA